MTERPQAFYDITFTAILHA